MLLALQLNLSFNFDIYLFVLDTQENPPDLESVFFDLEVEMENDICRDLICTSEAKETGRH